MTHTRKALLTLIDTSANLRDVVGVRSVPKNQAEQDLLNKCETLLKQWIAHYNNQIIAKNKELTYQHVEDVNYKSHKEKTRIWKKACERHFTSKYAEIARYYEHELLTIRNVAKQALAHLNTAALFAKQTKELEENRKRESAQQQKAAREAQRKAAALRAQASQAHAATTSATQAKLTAASRIMPAQSASPGISQTTSVRSATPVTISQTPSVRSAAPATTSQIMSIQSATSIAPTFAAAKKPTSKLSHKPATQQDSKRKPAKTSSPEVTPATISPRRDLAKKRWKKAIDAIRSNVRLDTTQVPLLGMSELSFHLEKLDPKHRLGRELILEFDIWKHSTTKENFFTWLDQKENKTKNYLTRLIYRTQENEQNEILVKCNQDKLFIQDKLCDTTQYQGKSPGYGAFSLSKNNKLYINEHVARREVHASLQGGERVACAGMIKVQKGKITELTNYSGHYQPKLKNLLYAVKKIPANSFSADAKITYHVRRFESLSRRLLDSQYAPIRSLGTWLSRRSKQVSMPRKDFINFAEKQLEQTEKKFIHKRDKKDNRFENTLYESHLAKLIIENDKTWRPLVLKINDWIYKKILANKTDKKVIALVVSNLKKHLATEINEHNCLEVAKKFLYEPQDITHTALFHGDFFEYIHPKIKGEKSYKDLPVYKDLRADNLFGSENRGVAATTDWQRRVAKWKHPFYRSDALGIMPDEETPAALSHYFEGQPGKRKPTKRLHKLKGERLTYAAAQHNRDSKMDARQTFREEVISRDISLASGASGTTSKIVASLIDNLGISREEAKTYLMVQAAALTAYGHHSIYEIMVLARQLGFPIEYNHRFYHEQFLTKEFRDSPEYKAFLASYSDLVKPHIPKPPESEARAHETYVKIKREMEHKKTFFSDEIKSFDQAKLHKQTVNALIDEKSTKGSSTAFFKQPSYNGSLPKAKQKSEEIAKKHPREAMTARF